MIHILVFHAQGHPPLHPETIDHTAHLVAKLKFPTGLLQPEEALEAAFMLTQNHVTTWSTARNDWMGKAFDPVEVLAPLSIVDGEPQCLRSTSIGDHLIMVDDNTDFGIWQVMGKGYRKVL